MESSFSKRPPIIGVMGPGSSATDVEIYHALILGEYIADEGWWILTGGGKTGVMNAALKGFKRKSPGWFNRDGKPVFSTAVLSNRGEAETTSEYIDFAVPTGLGEGRNNLNVKSSDIIVVCCHNLWKSPGTMSEVVFAIKHNKPLVFIFSADFEENDRHSKFVLHYMEDFTKYGNYTNTFQIVWSPDQAISFMRKHIEEQENFYMSN